MSDLTERMGLWRECQSGLEHDYGTCAAGCKDGWILNEAAVRAAWAMVDDARIWASKRSGDLREGLNAWADTVESELEAAGCPRPKEAR